MKTPTPLKEKETFLGTITGTQGWTKGYSTPEPPCTETDTTGKGRFSDGHGGSAAAPHAAPSTHTVHLLAPSREIPMAARALQLASTLAALIPGSFLAGVTKRRFSFPSGAAVSLSALTARSCRLRSRLPAAPSTYCWRLTLPHVNLPCGSGEFLAPNCYLSLTYCPPWLICRFPSAWFRSLEPCVYSWYYLNHWSWR